MRELLELSGLVLLVLGAATVLVALGTREVRVARQRRTRAALAAVAAARPPGRLSKRVRRAVLLELAELFTQDTLEQQAPGHRATAVEATQDLRARRWTRRSRGLRTLQSLGLTTRELVRGLRDPHPRVRAQAATAAVDRDEPEVLEALVDLLQDEDAYVRFTALDAVTRRSTGTAEALAVALDRTPLLDREHLPELERAVADADARAAEAVRDLARPDPDEVVAPGDVPRTERVASGVVAVALRGTEDDTPGRPGTLPRPLRATTFPSTATRTLVLLLTGASTTTDPGSIPSVARFTGDARPEVRSAALGALAALGADRDLLLPGLQDPDGRVRAAAVTALARSGDRTLAGLLAAQLADRDHGVRQAAAAALTGLGAAGRLLLQDAVSGPDRYAADAARSALGLPPQEPA